MIIVDGQYQNQHHKNYGYKKIPEFFGAVILKRVQGRDGAQEHDDKPDDTYHPCIVPGAHDECRT